MSGRQNIQIDGDYYMSQLAGRPGFLVSYQLIKGRDADDDTEVCEADDNGYDDYHCCEPDEYDVADGKDAVSLAIDYLNYKCVEFSGSDWWTDADADYDYRSGDETRHSYHPENFSNEQIAAIIAGVKA